MPEYRGDEYFEGSQHRLDYFWPLRVWPADALIFFDECVRSILSDASALVIGD